MKPVEALPPEAAEDHGVTLEDVLLDPTGAEAIRAAVDGEWLETDADA